MHPVAFAPPVWAATLRAMRRFTRMAATALVLVVGLNGLTAPVPADPLRPVSTVRPPAGPQVSQGPVDAPTALSLAGPADAAPALSAMTVVWASEAGVTTADSATLRAASTAPATAAPSRHVEPQAAMVRPAAAVVAPSADPGRESATRRGPPRA
ncbi:hypothetical protein ONA70_07555 [Micromonospora yasonensis]|uniref:hypothetical protein n=1 Tax=Micromonospora yasonensis TaxID=1128667 RepID=UPI00222E834F|nr:hypothetical protein [Micromonospora yasonensis]MCW3839951.1 hypothetical protein [Micromonospora yasonensis]